MQHSDEFNALCDDAKTRIKEITIDDVCTTLQSPDETYLIDVRDQDEYERGHLPGANFLSKGWIEAKIHHLVNNKNAHIILYCGGGNRSALAADNLQKMGYTHVLSMKGGFKAWMAEGRSVTTE